MAINGGITNNGSTGSTNATNTGSSSNSGIHTTKRPLQLTNCQLIDCIANSSSTTTTTTANSSSSSSNVRYQARTVCWNASGSLLAVGCSDSMIRFWNPNQQQHDTGTTTTTTVSTSSSSSSGSCCKDVGIIHTTSPITTSTTTAAASSTTSSSSSGTHGGPIIAATFQPTSDSILCSMTAGTGMIRLWDIRNHNNTNSSGSITSTLTGSTTATMVPPASNTQPPIYISVEWNPIQTHFISCTTHDGTVSIYDTRKFTTTIATSSTTNKNTTTALVQQIQFPHVNDRIESCIFDRVTGKYILGGVSNRNNHSLGNSHISGGMGYIKVCAWEDNNNSNSDHNMSKTTTKEQYRQWYTYPAHAGPIYTIVSNRCGSRLATGGSDAVVGLWDTYTMSCIRTISSRTKFIRSLSFSYDDQILAIATEEDGIELIDCTVATTTNNCIGVASLSNTNSGSSSSRRTSMMPIPGVEDIAFHPTSSYLLACARTNDISTSSGMSSVTLVKLTITA